MREARGFTQTKRTTKGPKMKNVNALFVIATFLVRNEEGYEKSYYRKLISLDGCLCGSMNTGVNKKVVSRFIYDTTYNKTGHECLGWNYYTSEEEKLIGKIIEITPDWTPESWDSQF